MREKALPQHRIVLGFEFLFFFFIESGYHVTQTGLKLLNLLSASTFQVLGLDLYAYHVWFYAALGQTQGFIA